MLFDINWDGHVVPLLHSINVVNCIHWFCMLNFSCISGINPLQLWHKILLTCCWILFASICWGVSYLHSQGNLVCTFLILSGFSIMVMSASYNELRSILSYSVYWKSLSIHVNSLNVSRNHNEAIYLAQGFSVLGDFWLLIQPPYLLKVHSDFPFL